jgi:hypothetical protein
MRTLTIVMGLVLLGGCDRDNHGRHDAIYGSRWQLVQQPDAAAVWRLDTATGSLSYCNADFTTRLVLCMPQAVAPAQVTSAPAATVTQPVTAAPVYSDQPRSPAP